MTTRVPLYFRPGDDETRVFQYLDSAGVVVNITGFTAVWMGDVAGTVYSTTGTVDGPNGKVTVRVSDVHTTALGAAGWHGSYVLVITSSGGEDTTIAEGPLILLGE